LWWSIQSDRMFGRNFSAFKWPVVNRTNTPK
jgi:hypothetical protein